MNVPDTLKAISLHYSEVLASKDLAVVRAREAEAEVTQLRAQVEALVEALTGMADTERRSDCNDRKCGGCSLCVARTTLAKHTKGTR